MDAATLKTDKESGIGLRVKRPFILNLLCVLSLLHGAVNLLSGSQYALTDAAEKDLAASANMVHDRNLAVEARGQAAGSLSLNLVYPMNRIGRPYQLPLARSTGTLYVCSAIVSLIGVVLMLRRQRTGYALYLLAGSVELFALWRYQGTADLPGAVNVALGIAFALLFAGAYIWVLKYMR